MKLPAATELPAGTEHRAWRRRLLDHGRRLIAERVWPGMEGYVRPKAVPVRPARLRDRLALIVVGLPELGAVPDALGLAGWLLVHAGLVCAGGVVCPDGLREHDAEAYAELERWCATHRVRTTLGPRRWQLTDLTTFSRTVLFRHAYRGRSVVIGWDLGRTLGLAAGASTRVR
jgi:hypothetical protein